MEGFIAEFYADFALHDRAVQCPNCEGVRQTKAMGPQSNKAGIQTVQGEALWKALGFRNERAFQRARQNGWAEVALFPISNQSRGVYARLDDLNAFLQRKAASAGKEDP